ncbi:MAG TPA: AbrB family transcriptional regulator [Beijerinckiaceae bacterium]|jgi:membrane AbrB-like protein
MPRFAAHLLQIAAAALGGWLFHALGIPAAWLSGAVVACVALSVFGVGLPLPKPLVDAAMLASGATMGASVTPEAVAAMARYPASLALLVMGVVAITGGSMIWLVRVSRWRVGDAMLASVPGAFSTVLAVATERGVDIGPVAVVQAFRLFLLITVLPSAVVAVGGDSGRSAMLLGEGLPVASPVGLSLVLAGGLALGLAFARIGMAAPILLGATLASALAHGTGAIPGVVPPVIATAGLVLLGVYVAERFTTLDRGVLRRTVPAAVASFVIGSALAVAFAVASAALAGVGLADALVAFAPGGLEAMMVLALVLGLDPLYVGVHHLVRFLGIGFALPLVYTWMRRRGG